MLDAISFEKRGIPAAVVITSPFAATADAMARLAGMPGYRYAVVPHPIGSLGPAEIRTRADQVAASVESLLLSPMADEPGAARADAAMGVPQPERRRTAPEDGAARSRRE